MIEVAQLSANNSERRGDSGSTKLLYDRHATADLLSVSAGTVDNMVKDGRLRPVYIGRLPRFTLAELQRFCRELEQKNAESEKESVVPA